MRVQIRAYPTSDEYFGLFKKYWWWPFWIHVETVRGIEAARATARRILNPVVEDLK